MDAVETMMYNNQNGVPWHGLGNPVPEAVTSEIAIDESGLNWLVEKVPALMYWQGQLVEIPNRYHIRRATDGVVYNDVSGRYTPVQNAEAFAWTDALLGGKGNVRYETAGSLFGGAVVWLLAKINEEYRLAGDPTTIYLCFRNSHDGSAPVQVCITPIRVVCNNTLNLAIRGTKRMWATRHTGKMDDKLALAAQTLQMTERYVAKLRGEAERLASFKVNAEKLVNELFPMKEDVTKRTSSNTENNRIQLMDYINKPDLANFKNTAWAFINGVADMVGHAPPARKTETFEENRWNQIMVGHKLLDEAYSIVNDFAKGEKLSVN